MYRCYYSRLAVCISRSVLRSYVLVFAQSLQFNNFDSFNVQLCMFVLGRPQLFLLWFCCCSLSLPSNFAWLCLDVRHSLHGGFTMVLTSCYACFHLSIWCKMYAHLNPKWFKLAPKSVSSRGLKTYRIFVSVLTWFWTHAQFWRYPGTTLKTISRPKTTWEIQCGRLWGPRGRPRPQKVDFGKSLESSLKK